ncbi:hypothetical protein [Paraburkholderia humisilvae]|uniref:Uncharacterized protein n=1 Tax=Paraburkholderia humisilvae TaxID=627669 RepID=A0A6J5ERF5_9BURK|nr:hypothetical protein [Paraburkholderia humisilvae]CAB3769079.1 hypothetical protein LMG29542_06031 [Paraburkholderia humisilvae]
MDTLKLKCAAMSNESDSDNASSERTTGRGRPVQERNWPWSTGHFDWMDQYCPTPVEIDDANTDGPILAA